MMYCNFKQAQLYYRNNVAVVYQSRLVLGNEMENKVALGGVSTWFCCMG